MGSVSHSIDQLEVTFDDESLVASQGLITPATLMTRPGHESLVDATMRLSRRVGGSHPGRKVGSLVATMLAGGSHIDHADGLRSGATQRVLPFRVMAPSTLGIRSRAATRQIADEESHSRNALPQGQCRRHLVQFDPAHVQWTPRPVRAA